MLENMTDKPIIVPWDFSDMSKSALDEALNICTNREQIEIVHVTPYPSAAEPNIVWGTYSEDDIRENLEKSFRQTLPDEKYSGLHFSASFGDPGSRIAELANQSGAGLIIVSSHGRTGLKRMLLGSVAERVVRLAPCPVLVLRGTEQLDTN